MKFELKSVFHFGRRWLLTVDLQSCYNILFTPKKASLVIVINMLPITAKDKHPSCLCSMGAVAELGVLGTGAELIFISASQFGRKS